MEKTSNPIERFLKLRQVFEQTKNQKELDTLARICFHFDCKIDEMNPAIKNMTVSEEYIASIDDYREALYLIYNGIEPCDALYSRVNKLLLDVGDDHDITKAYRALLLNLEIFSLEKLNLFSLANKVSRMITLLDRACISSRTIDELVDLIAPVIYKYKGLSFIHLLKKDPTFCSIFLSLKAKDKRGFERCFNYTTTYNYNIFITDMVNDIAQGDARNLGLAFQVFPELKKHCESILDSWIKNECTLAIDVYGTSMLLGEAPTADQDLTYEQAMVPQPDKPFNIKPAEPQGDSKA